MAEGRESALARHLVLTHGRIVVSDIAIFVLKRDVKLQLTNGRIDSLRALRTQTQQDVSGNI